MAAPVPRLSLDDAVRRLRTAPEHAATVRDAYLGDDVEDSARRFAASGEFAAVVALLGNRLPGATVLDLGAGTGIASLAFLAHGAAQTIAVEPDPSELVGRGALARLCAGRPVRVLADGGEKLSVASGTVDIVYARQVLHHLQDLERALGECARVLRPGGIFLACREHVADDARQLAEFLAAHPVHQLAGGEHAFPAARYRAALAAAGLVLDREFETWDTVINAYPLVADECERAGYPRRWLQKKFGAAGRWLARIPGVERVIWHRVRRPRAGRLYTYLAHKPG